MILKDFFRVRPSFVFFSVQRRPADSNFWHFQKKKKKCNDVGKPFFSSNNCFNLKSEHSNGIKKNRNKNRNPLYSILLNFPITSTNFSAILILGSCLVICRLHSNDAEVPGLLFREFLLFFLFVFLVFQSDRPTQYQETHSTLNEKKGMA